MKRRIPRIRNQGGDNCLQTKPPERLGMRGQPRVLPRVTGNEAAIVESTTRSLSANLGSI